MKDSILQIKSLGFKWEVANPFIFCVHHLDYYPEGNGQLGPNAPLTGRNIGQDFIIKDGWRMYHGKSIPGFPVHPHRGFETVTIVLQGYVDHSDSLGAAGRYSAGDVQWMTAGSGIQHSEMFPLLNDNAENTLELFQIWLNLPKARKFVKPGYKMFWKENIPTLNFDAIGSKTEVRIISGKYESETLPSPPQDSWASDTDNFVSIWIIKMNETAEWVVPEAVEGLNRMLFFFEGDSISINGTDIPAYSSILVESDQTQKIRNKSNRARLLLLQGRPINEPVMQYGPFVMNTTEEIQQAYNDYKRTLFGGWPWDSNEQVHGKENIRFAKHVDGTEDFPDL